MKEYLPKYVAAVMMLICLFSCASVLAGDINELAGDETSVSAESEESSEQNVETTDPAEPEEETTEPEEETTEFEEETSEPEEETTEQEIEPSVMMENDTVEVLVGDTVTLKVNILPSAEAVSSSQWSTSDRAIVSVSTSGVVSAKAEGTATITFTAVIKGVVYRTSCVVKVKVPEPVLSVKFGLNAQPEQVNVNSTVQMKATISENPGIDYFVVAIKYDTSRFSVSGVARDSALAGNGTLYSNQLTADEDGVIMVKWEGKRVLTASAGNLFVVTFNVKSTAAKGVTYFKYVNPGEALPARLSGYKPCATIGEDKVARNPLFDGSGAATTIINTYTKADFYSEAADNSFAPGESFEMQLKVRNNPGMASYRFSFSYNPKALELVSVARGSLNSSYGRMGINKNTDGKLYVSWEDNTKNVYLDGAVLTLTFKVEECGGGDVSFNYNFDSGDYVKNAAGTKLTFTSQKFDASITASKTIKYKDALTVVPLSDSNLIWTSSNPGAVTVDTNGNVTTVAEGSATITATTDKGVCVARTDVSVYYTIWQKIIIYILFGWIWYI